MAEDKRLVLLNRFLSTFEKLIYSDLPKDEKLSYAKTLYLAFCCAIDKKPDYELILAKLQKESDYGV